MSFNLVHHLYTITALQGKDEFISACDADENLLVTGDNIGNMKFWRFDFIEETGNTSSSPRKKSEKEEKNEKVEKKELFPFKIKVKEEWFINAHRLNITSIHILKYQGHVLILSSSSDKNVKIHNDKGLMMGIYGLTDKWKLNLLETYQNFDEEKLKIKEDNQKEKSEEKKKLLEKEENKLKERGQEFFIKKSNIVKENEKDKEFLQKSPPKTSIKYIKTIPKDEDIKPKENADEVSQLQLLKYKEYLQSITKKPSSTMDEIKASYLFMDISKYGLAPVILIRLMKKNTKALFLLD